MTNQEYLLKSLLGCGVPEETIDLMLLKENLPPQGEVSIGDCDLAMYKHVEPRRSQGVLYRPLLRTQ